MSAPIDNPFNLGELSEELRAYLCRIGRPEHPELAALRERTAALPFVAMMQGSPALGQLLQFIIGLIGARHVLEVGVFTGCSTLAMATAIPPDGRIVAIEVNEKWAAVGREFWVRSGYADRIDLRIGSADEVLDALIAQGLGGTFDLAFIDANKDGYEGYLEQSLVLLRDNGVMVFDNVLFGGRVPISAEAQASRESPNLPRFLQEVHVRFAEGLRRFNERVARDERVDIVVLPMMDGVTLARKKSAMSKASHPGERRNA